MAPGGDTDKVFVEAVTGRVWRCPPSQAVGRLCFPCLARPAGLPHGLSGRNVFRPFASPSSAPASTNVGGIPFTNRDKSGLALPAIQVRFSRSRGTVQ